MVDARSVQQTTPATRRISWRAMQRLVLACSCTPTRCVCWLRPVAWCICRARTAAAARPQSHSPVLVALAVPAPSLTAQQVTGACSQLAPDAVHDIQGGFFCDEPGLGKTVTALSLILKTQVRQEVPHLAHRHRGIQVRSCVAARAGEA
jgi:hypothetical protein